MIATGARVYRVPGAGHLSRSPAPGTALLRTERHRAFRPVLRRPYAGRAATATRSGKERPGVLEADGPENDWQGVDDWEGDFEVLKERLI